MFSNGRLAISSYLHRSPRILHQNRSINDNSRRIFTKTNVIRNKSNSTIISTFDYGRSYFGTNSSSTSTKNLPAAGEFSRDELRRIQTEIRRKLTESDGLNSNDWTLIYMNRLADDKLIYLWPVLTVITIMLGAVIVLVTLQLFSAYYTNQLTRWDTTRGCGAMAFGLCGIAYLTRWRRLMAIRLYRRRISTMDQAKREYCVVWYDFWRRKKLFYYDHTETSRAREVRSIFPSASFYARDRPWFVHVGDFIKHDDYFYARMPAVDDQERK